jgi:thiosulfate/3-mercaptopyruvate sulfurtransferase
LSRFISGAEAAASIRSGAVLFDTRGRLSRLARPLRGAVAYAWKDWREGTGRTGLLPTDLGPLRAWLAARGLQPERPIVVAGDGGRSWGEEARLAWTLEVLGPHTVFVVDGGARALRSASQSREPQASTPTPRASRCRLADVEAAIARNNATLWDTRTRAEWSGAQLHGEARGGHLPGARSLPIQELFDDQGFLLPRNAAKAALSAACVPLDQPVIAYCTGGVRSALACAVLTHLGHTRAQNYDGGIWEWSAAPGLPLV